jgi:cyclase
MTAKPYKRGAHRIGDGAWAYLQPDGGWGWSNAGLIIGQCECLLVDTLFDERLTASMLQELRATSGKTPQEIGVVVNTHANGDHSFGNALLPSAEIIASRSSATEMAEVTPNMLAQMMASSVSLGETGEYLRTIFGSFHFDSARGRLPTRTFDGELQLQLGDCDVHLIEVGPAHTEGDVLVHVPRDRVVYTGDILFIDSTPIMWAGPIGNWLKACERIAAMDVDVIVPGHGPMTDRGGVERVAQYLRYIDAEARKRFDAGMSAEEATFDIALSDFDSWIDAERIAVNVDTLFREYRGDRSARDVGKLFALMGRLYRSRRR